MNCTDARAQLPELLYGDPTPALTAEMREHLAGCLACRERFAELEQVRGSLDAMPAPVVQVDLARLYRTAADRQVRRLRRWRRAALAAGAVAALLLLGFGLRLEARVESHQLVLRWGGGPVEEKQPAPAPTVMERIRPDPELEERIGVLSAVLHALAEQAQERDARQQQLFAGLLTRLDNLQWTGNARWNETQRVAARVAAQFGSPPPGER